MNILEARGYIHVELSYPYVLQARSPRTGDWVSLTLHTTLTDARTHQAKWTLETRVVPTANALTIDAP